MLLGYHHLTAVTARAGANHAFYAGVLGMRLVKKSVNQDDLGAYHLFYGDGVGTAGSDITFFEWPMPRERRGGRSVARTSLRVADGAALAFWARRLAEAGVAHRGVATRGGRAELAFEDPEGQRLALVADDGAGEAVPWPASPVPPAHQIRGLGPVRIAVPDLAATEAALVGLLGMRRLREDEAGAAPVHVYALGEGAGPAFELEVVVEPGPPASPGAGGVHHVAFRVADSEHAAWAERLRARRVPASGPIDRHYFRSLYFREPGGVLFEIATEGPGFAVDEPVERLGERLALPPGLEPRRAEIEAGLIPF